MKIMLDEGAKMPTRAHEWDGGLDIYSRDTKLIPGRGRAVFNTGVPSLAYYDESQLTDIAALVKKELGIVDKPETK